MDAQLNMFAAPERDPNIEWLERTLHVCRDWLTARELAAASGGRLDDRAIRALASASDSVISGQKGYRHADHATLDEIDRAATWLESQSSAMKERAIRLRRRAHRTLG